MVLRLWREHQGAAWRLTVQEVGQDSRHSFPDLDSLMAHLLRIMVEPLVTRHGPSESDDAANEEEI